MVVRIILKIVPLQVARDYFPPSNVIANGMPNLSKLRSLPPMDEPIDFVVFDLWVLLLSDII